MRRRCRARAADRDARPRSRCCPNTAIAGDRGDRDRARPADCSSPTAIGGTTLAMRRRERSSDASVAASVTGSSEQHRGDERGHPEQRGSPARASRIARRPTREAADDRPARERSAQRPRRRRRRRPRRPRPSSARESAAINGRERGERCAASDPGREGEQRSLCQSTMRARADREGDRRGSRATAGTRGARAGRRAARPAHRRGDAEHERVEQQDLERPPGGRSRDIRSSAITPRRSRAISSIALNANRKPTSALMRGEQGGRLVVRRRRLREQALRRSRRRHVEPPRRDPPQRRACDAARVPDAAARRCARRGRACPVELLRVAQRGERRPGWSASGPTSRWLDDRADGRRRPAGRRTCSVTLSPKRTPSARASGSGSTTARSRVEPPGCDSRSAASRRGAPAAGRPPAGRRARARRARRCVAWAQHRRSGAHARAALAPRRAAARRSPPARARRAGAARRRRGRG